MQEIDRILGLESFSWTDEDEDGLPDVVEEDGMLGLDGHFYYSSTNHDTRYDSTGRFPGYDSDYDTISDGVEMGTMYSIRRADEEHVQICGAYMELSDVPNSQFANLERYIPNNPGEICFVFDVLSDPSNPDTDGDGYRDGHPLEQNPSVSEVFYYGIDRESYCLVEYNGSYYYGSNQRWFYDDLDDPDDDVIRDILGDDYDSESIRLFYMEEGGCGLMSAADLLAYYSIVNPDLSCLYPYNSFNYNNAYYNYLDELSNFISPWDITPQPVEISTPWGTFRGTLGITQHMYMNGLQQYCNNIGVQIEGHTALAWSEDYLSDFIIESYEHNCLPVLYLGGTYLYLYKEDNSAPERCRFHWVNVIGFERDFIEGESYLYIATWGEVRIIKFSDILAVNPSGNINSYRSMMFYFECQSS